MHFAEDKVPAVDFRFHLIIGLFSDEEIELKSMSGKKGKEKFKAKKKIIKQQMELKFCCGSALKSYLKEMGNKLKNNRRKFARKK